MKKKQEIIKFRQSLFWDVDPKSIDPKRNARYVIERILDFGTDEEIQWMWRFYKHSLIEDVVKKSRVLHKKTRRFWALMFS